MGRVIATAPGPASTCHLSLETDTRRLPGAGVPTILSAMSPRALALALLLTGACGRPHGDAGQGGPTAADPWALQALGALGDRAAYVVVVDLRAWPELRARIAETKDVLFTPEVYDQWIAPAAAATPQERLAGIDLTRPVVAALAEPPGDAPHRTFQAGLPLVTGVLPGLRHEVLIPATDVDLLRRSLSGVLDGLGTARPDLTRGRGDVLAWQIGGVLVTLRAGQDHVRAVAIADAVGTADPPASLWREPGEPAPRTPGVLTSAQSEDPIRILVRTRPQARLALWEIVRGGLGRGARLPVSAQRQAALLQALRCEALLHEGGAEIDDVALTLAPADKGLRLRAVVSLGDAGAKVLSAGVAPAGPLRQTLRADLGLEAWLRFSFDDALAAASDVSPMSGLEDATKFAETCGAHAPALLAPSPFAGLKKLHAAVAEASSIAQASVYQVAIDASKPGPLHVAASVEVAGDPETWTSSWFGLGRLLDAEPRITRATVEGRTRLDVGFGGPASELLGEPRARDPDDLAGFDLRLTTLRSRLGEEAGLAPLMQHDRVQLALRRSGRALVGHLLLDDAAPPPPLDLSQVTWPERPSARIPGEACAVGAALAAADILSDADRLGPATSERIMRERAGAGGKEALAGLEAGLQCSEGPDPATAAALRRLWTLGLAGALVERWRFDEARRLLDDSCAAGRDEQICAGASDLQALARPRIPDVFVLCRDLVSDPQALRVAFAPGKISLDERPLADLAALARELEARRDAAGGELSVVVGADRDMRFADVRPLFAALAALKGLRVAVALREELSDNGDVVGLPITLELGDAEPRGEPERSLREKMRARVFAADARSIRLRIGMINLGVDPNPSPGALQIGTATHVTEGEEPMVHATDDTPWATVAIALAGSCTGARLVDPAREQTLLGPAWRDADCLAVYFGPKALSVTPRGRGPNNINSALLGVRPKLEACYAQGLIERPDLAGQVVMRYRVETNGDMSEASVERSSLRAPAVEQCMVDALRTASHSGAERPVVIRYAFDFSTRR